MGDDEQQIVLLRGQLEQLLQGINITVRHQKVSDTDRHVDDLESDLRVTQYALENTERRNERLKEVNTWLRSEVSQMEEVQQARDEKTTQLEELREAVKAHFRCSDELLGLLVERWRTQGKELTSSTDNEDLIEDRYAMLELD